MSDNPIFRFNILRRNGLQPLGDPSQFLPKRATPRSTGYDVRAAVLQPLVVRPGKYIKIPLGFRVFAPPGWWLELRPRSSTFGKKQLHCLYGVIDEDYEGECLFAGHYLPDISSLGNDLVIEFGDAIGQVIPVERKEMEVLEVNDEEYEDCCTNRGAHRGAGGFGSTGK